MTALPSVLTKLKYLTSINAAENEIAYPSPDDVESMPDLTGLSNLRDLRMCDNPYLKALPAHFATWASTADGPSLRTVNFANCGFESWDSLQPLGGQQHLDVLKLQGNSFVPLAKSTSDLFVEYRVQVSQDSRPDFRGHAEHIFLW